MENKQKNREWVKTAVIIFLVIMLVLTFFSNTIQNYTLTEVSTEQVKAGTIAERVRCTGKVISMGNTEVKAEGTRTIAGVKVKIGQEVNEGDILFVMGSAATDEVETATDARDTAYYAYKKAQVSYPAGPSTANMNSAYQRYLSAYDEEQIAYAAYVEAALQDEQVKQAKEGLTNAEINYTSAQNFGNDYRQQMNAEYILEAAKEEPNPELLEYYLKEATTITDQETMTKFSYEQALALYNSLLAYNNSAVLKTQYEAAKTKRESAESTYLSAVESYNTSLSSGGNQYATAAINEEEAENTLNKKQAKLDYLTGEGVDVNIYAPVSGKIQSIGKSAGSKVVKDDVLCVIEVPDQGYTMEASVTAEQAKRLKVGDESVKSMYGGDSVDGTIISIRPDPKDPQNKRIIEFDLTGKTDNLENGKEITLTVGQKSVSYDLVVPKSAILSDTNGKFVLKIESKSSALGNRYFARRVDVQEIASDDSSCAVTGDLQQNSDHVITNSSAPVKAGNQIRLSDAS